jgi:hypothetical protein
MNANPNFRYYAAFVLILMLVLMLRVQAHPTGASEPVGQVANATLHGAVGPSAGR